jgi:hypothetical protein
VSDDWRVTIRLPEGSGWRDIVDRLHEDEVARAAHGQRVALSFDHEVLHAYGDTGEAVEGVREAIERVLRERGLSSTQTVLERWHPEEERWEDGSVPLPSTPAEHEAEHARHEAQEAADSSEPGGADWEVDAEVPSRHAAVELAERLEAEGLPVRRWWRVVRVGAATDDDARALAERIRAEAPPGTEVRWQGAAADVWAILRPFPELGGLGN